MSSAATKKYTKQTSPNSKKESKDLQASSIPLPTPLKYKLYCAAVQTPNQSVQVFDKIYTANFNKKALSFREDFCGTFLVGCEWTKSDPERTALGVDLGQEPLRIAKQNISSHLKPNDRKRAILCRQDVRVPTIPRVDLIGAENFSYLIFKKRSELVSYFRAAYSSLNNNGALILDMIGGPGFIDTPNDSVRTLNSEEIGIPARAVYRWRQRQYNPVTNEALYHIDFKLNDQWYKNVFTYDWRVWSLPEVADALKEAGFDDTIVYWSKEESGRVSVKPVTKIASDWETWMCFVAGIKKRA